MKIIIFIMCFAAAAARGVPYSETFTENTAIPDGNPVGVAFTGNFNQDPNAGDVVDNLTVTLDVSSGYNGDLYAYLDSPSGVEVTLLNRPGVSGSNPFGYGGSGLDVTLSAAGSGNIQSTPETDGITFTGTYQAASGLADFNGSPVEGAWTLYFADESSGGGTSMLNSWALNFSTVPDSGMSVGLLGLGLLAICGIRLWRENRLGRHT